MYICLFGYFLVLDKTKTLRIKWNMKISSRNIYFYSMTDLHIYCSLWTFWFSIHLYWQFFFLNILVNEKYLKILWTMKWLKERRKLRNIHKHVCIYTHIYIHYTRNHIQLNKQKHTVRIHSNTETLAYTHTSISTHTHTLFITVILGSETANAMAKRSSQFCSVHNDYKVMYLADITYSKYLRHTSVAQEAMCLSSKISRYM